MALLLDCKSSFTKVKSFTNVGIFRRRCISSCPWSEVNKSVLESKSSMIIIGLSIQLLVEYNDNTKLSHFTTGIIQFGR